MGPPLHRNLKYWDKYCTGGKVVATSNRFVPLKSKLRRDVVFDKFCSDAGITVTREFAPAPLNVDALYMGLGKHCKPKVFSVNNERWGKAVRWMRQEFFAKLAGSKLQCVAEVMPQENGSTSPGPAFKPNYQTKQEVFDDSGRPIFRFMKRLGKKTAPRSLWGGCLKDEMRLMEKVKANKARYFMSSPVDHATPLDCYCRDFNNRFYEMQGTASAIGITPFLGGWDRLYRWLRKGSDDCADLDVSNWDGNMACEFFDVIRDFRFDCLAPQFRTEDTYWELYHLYEDIKCTLIVNADGLIVEKEGGNPSGSANTVVDNTLGLFLVYAYGFLCQYPDSTYGEFKLALRVKLYGDDSIFTRSPGHGFSLINFAHDIRDAFGMELTTDDWSWRPIDRCKFLSCGFRWNKRHEMYLPNNNCEKFISGMIDASKGPLISHSYERACAYRILSYWTPQFQIFDQYCQFLIQTRSAEIDVQLGFAHQTIYKTEDDLVSLYCGFEPAL